MTGFAMGKDGWKSIQENNKERDTEHGFWAES